MKSAILFTLKVGFEAGMNVDDVEERPRQDLVTIKETTFSGFLVGSV